MLHNVRRPDERLTTLRSWQDAGTVRYIGISTLSMRAFLRRCRGGDAARAAQPRLDTIPRAPRELPRMANFAPGRTPCWDRARSKEGQQHALESPRLDGSIAPSSPLARAGLTAGFDPEQVIQGSRDSGGNARFLQ